MPWRRRKRTKSSPGQKPTLKNNRQLYSEKSDNEASIYQDSFDNIDETVYDIHVDTSNNVNTLTSILNMLSISKDDLLELSALLAPLIVHDLKAQLKREVLTEIREEITATIDSSTKTFRNEIESLKLQNAGLKSKLQEARMEHDDLAQYGRRMCLDICGIPGDTGSSDEQVEKKILDYCTKAGVPVTPADIDKCHRKGRFRPEFKTQRKVMVKFTNSKARQRIYDNRKSFGERLFVQENLTPFREKLSFEARTLKRAGVIDKTWISGCRVLILLKNETRGRVISSMEQIESIRDGRPQSVAPPASQRHDVTAS